MEVKSLFSNSNFLKLWGSQLFSQFALNLANFLLLYRLYTNTSSTVAVSFLWLAYAVPALLVGPFAAAFVDQVSRKKTIVITNLLQALTVLLYTLIETRLFLIYGVVFIYSFLNQFYMPAEIASMPKLIRKKLYAQANGLFILTQQISLMVGFGLGGFLNKTFGFNLSMYFASSLLFLAFLAATTLPEIKDGKNVDFERAVGDFFNKVIEGYNFIRNNRIVLYPFLLLAGFQIAVTVFSINVPSLAVEVFKLNVNDASIILVIPAAVGAIIATFLIPRFLGMGVRKKRIIEVSLFIIFLGLLSVAFLVDPLPVYQKPFMLGAISFVGGMAFVGIVVPTQTFLQEITPGGLRGRLFGNFWFIVTAATVAPIILSATITEFVGVRVLFVVLSLLAFSVFIYSRLRGEKLVLSRK